MTSSYETCPKCGMKYHIKAGACPKCGIKYDHSTGMCTNQIGTESGPKEHYKKIAREMGDDQFFTKKELNYLPEILRDGEEVLAFSSGLMDGNTWLITLTNKRIIFLDKGIIYGLKQATIDLKKVNSVTCTTGLLLGTITITDGARDRTIKNVLKKTVKPFINKVQDAVEALSPQQQQQGNDDPLQILEKLAQLKETGIITQEDFDKKKADILSTL